MAAVNAVRRRRPRGSGAVFVDARKRWCGEYQAWDLTKGKQVKHRIYGATRSEVEAKLHLALGKGLRPVVTSAKRKPPRLSEVQAIEWVLRDADRFAWDQKFTARVIVASTRPARLLHAVYGPCDYCGDWLADTVDHVIPRAAGGRDNPSNLVSACRACNTAKGDRPAESFRSAVRRATA